MGKSETTGVGRGQDVSGVGVGNKGRMYRCAAGRSGGGGRQMEGGFLGTEQA